MKIIGVIRSLGERTESLAIQELEKQVDKVFLVKDIKPLYKAVIKCIDIALEQNADYMITNDADVIIKEGCVETLLLEIKKCKSPLVTGYTISKFLGKRKGGVRIWNKNNLLEIKEFLINNGNTIRPESDIHHKFGGFLVDYVTSIHEYEQFYEDIYERFVKHSIKHKSKKNSNQIKQFEKYEDIDFKVAYCGFFDEEKNFKKSFPDLKEKNSYIMKPKICLIYDIEGWAYHNKSLAIKKYLNECYDIDLLKYNKHAKNSDYDKYDIILTYTPENLPRNISLEKVICGVSSHIKINSKIDRLQNFKYVFSNDYNIYNQIKNTFKDKNVYYTPNGVDCNFFKTDKIKSLNNKNEITIATIGNKKRESHKGKFRVENICENLNKLGYNIKNISLFVDVKNEKLTPENMINYYENIDIFLVSSVSEATPNTLLEAMSMGIPCISNDTGMASLLIENDKTGYIIDSYDNLKLYGKYIIKILENPSLYKSMSMNSLKKIKKYDWSEMSLFYKEMFECFMKDSNSKKIKKDSISITSSSPNKDWWIKKRTL